ncbi:MAG TPA: hypothetical protein VGS19_15165 [Streptosporangiaceae bacterium]|nr:hypothetical protein [Streptosporangiaceae bacterium]
MPAYARRAFVILFALVLALVIAAVMTWRSLPGSVAMFWTLGGHPRGHVPKLVAVIILLAVPLAFAAITATCPRLNLVLLMRAGFTSVGVLAAVVTGLRAVFTLSVNAAYGDAANVPVVVAVLAAVATVAVALLAALHVALAPVDGTAEPPAWRAGPGDEPLWRGIAMSRRPTINSIVFFVIGFGALYIGSDVTGLILALGAIVGGAFILSLTAIVVEIDHREFRVRYFGGARWPATHIPISAIREIELVNVDPRKSGGWGYRGSLRFGKAAALNVRQGPGLRLKLDGGRRFLITVDDPEGAAQILRQLVMTS